MAAQLSFESHEFLRSLLNSIIFITLGAALVTGVRRLDAIFGSSKASPWRRFCKRCAWHGFPTWRRLISRTCNRSRSLGARCTPVARCSQLCASSAREATPAQEQMTLEVGRLLSLERLRCAVDLLRAVRLARSGLQPGTFCFRLLLQRFARSPPRREDCTIFDEELAHHLVFPADTLTEGCYVRYLCRASDANVDKAYEAYSSMLQRGIPPDLRTVECLAEACLRANRHTLVKPLVLGLNDYGLEPSATLYVAFITCCGLTGAVAAGLTAFEQMRKHIEADPVALKLGYSSAVHMCAQNHQVDHALKLLAEFRHVLSERGLPTPNFEARLLPPVLAAAVQIDSGQVALELAARARNTLAVLAGSTDGREMASQLSSLCQLLARRSTSRALMEQVSAVLDSKPCVAKSGGGSTKHAAVGACATQASAAACRTDAEREARPSSNDKASWPQTPVIRAM